VTVAKRSGDRPPSGIPAKGRKHPPGCQCQRCRGFEEGNRVPVVHGAHSPLVISERGSILAEELRKDFATNADEAALQALAASLAQIQLATAALEQVAASPDARLKYVRLSDDLRGWISSLFKLLDRLGATPQARAQVAARLASVAPRLDLQKLSAKEKRQLESLLAKARDA
jgi:hypothetical protein